MSGDRHLRPDPDGKLRGSPHALLSVYVRVEPGYSETVAGQHLLQALVNLLSRQYGVVRPILLDVPPATVATGVFRRPWIDSGTLDIALIALGQANGGDLIETRPIRDDVPDVVIYVGGDLDPTAVQVPAIAVAGSGWQALVSTEGPLPGMHWDGVGLPLGPHLAACIAAGHVFKAAWGRTRSLDLRINLWSSSWDDTGPSVRGLVLPPTYVLGLGAVGAAFGYELAASEGLLGSLVAVDPQEMSDTDRNRLVSGNWKDAGESKTNLFKSLFGSGPFEVETCRGRWPEDYFGNPSRKVPAVLAESEREGRFEWIISCVDRNRDRSMIASQLPRHVLAGSSLGMAAQVAYYSAVGTCECLGCRHRSPAQLGIENLVDELKALTGDERRDWYDRYGATREQRGCIEEYLGDPSCAGPGAADLARLNVEGPVDWAVGYVSMAAGLLLATRFLRCILRGVNEEIAAGSEWRYLFWVDELRMSRAERIRDCPTCAGADATWSVLWPDVNGGLARNGQ